MQSVVPSEGSLGVKPPPAAEVRAHLQRILLSPSFRSSKRSQHFLSFVVESALTGKADQVKERTLAIEVFGRSQSWESSADTIVRVGAREVRKRLTQYYASAESALERVRIDLPPGSYVPSFHWADNGIVVAEVVAPEPRIPIVERRSWWPLLFVLAGIAILAATYRWIDKSAVSLRPYNEFWKPMWQVSEPVIIGLADPVVYLPGFRAPSDSNISVKKENTKPLTGTPGTSYIENVGQFVGFGDTVAAANMVQLAAMHAHEWRMRLVSRIEFNDLREAPAFLIGAFTNRWTLELTNNMRFRFATDAMNRPLLVDSQRPGRVWSIPKDADGSSPEDYFLICRLPNSSTGSFVIIAAGLTQFGTEDAAHVLSDAKLLTTLLSRVDKNWPKKNLQMVLHARIIGSSPGRPELVAFHTW